MSRALAVVVAVAVALIISGAVLAVLTTRQPEASFTAGTPEATVADYLRLLQNGDLEGGFALTSMHFGSRGMSLETFRNQNQHWSQTQHRVTLISSKTAGNQATVVVEVATFQPDAFGGGDRTTRQTFSLTRQDNAWRITAPTGLF